MILQCPAKINLFLKVTAKRPDGFHELQSLFAFLDLHDELQVEKSDKFSLEILGEFASKVDQDDNLFVTILNYFHQHFGVSKNLKIAVKKNIPVAAGLGGGSSNAAYFMLALNEIFALNLNLDELQKISLNFGSDIVFLLQRNAALVEGRGENITPFTPFAPIDALLINPKIAVATGAVFKNLNNNFSSNIAVNELVKKDVYELLQLENDLQKPAISALPLISDILKNCHNHHAKIAKMSGSGASCFAIFENEASLETAYNFFAQNFLHYFVKKVKILSHV